MQEKNCLKTVFFEKHWINDKMTTRAAFEIVNERGFHARPASLFVQCAEERSLCKRERFQYNVGVAAGAS